MDVFVNPDRFMERQKNVGTLFPVLIITVAAMLASFTAYITAPFMIESIKRQLLASKSGVTQEQMEVILSFTYYSMTVTPFIMTFVVWLIISLVLYFISNFFGGKGSFSTLAKLVAFSYIPVIILSPVTVYLAYESSKYLIYGTSHGYILPSTTIQVAILAWQSIYWTFAVKNARNLNLKSSAITALTVFVAYLIPTVFFLFSSLSRTL